MIISEISNCFVILKCWNCFKYALNQVEKQSDGQRYCSMGDDEGIAALFEGASYPGPLDLVADVPN